MERSFAMEVRSLALKAGEVFHGEGILAVTKALLQSGVSYIGGYQGAPVSHLIDVLGDARPLLDELGIYFEPSANEAGAAAMLAASIHYPVRGAVTWKSTVGTNVASDALSNLASAGVQGGALIVLGEDYGDGSSIIQERTHAFAMKSQIWLLDPRPEPGAIVDAVEHGFALSEASHTPVMLQLRIRACHVHGSFVCKDNRAPAVSMRAPIHQAAFDYGRVNLPPSTYEHERQKVGQRWPAAIDYLRRHRLNEVIDGDLGDVGLILPGGLYNGVIRALQQMGLADTFGATRVGLLVLGVVYPLDPDELATFCRGRRAVLVVEEGQPNYLEDAIHAALRRAGVDTTLAGKGCFPTAGEYTGEVLLKGLAEFLVQSAPQGLPTGPLQAAAAQVDAARNAALQALGTPVPNRPPGFCIGCPERPVFAAIKLLQQETGDLHVNADIGCHTFGTLPPFNIGSTVLGYGLGLASSSGVGPLMSGRTISLMGDGGFWHNGLTSGVVNAVTNRQDSVLVILKNGYTSATGAQTIPSSPGRPVLDIAHTLAGVGVKWIRTVPSYQVGDMLATLREAMSTTEPGLKVIIADGECQLERQRRIKPQIAAQLQQGERVVRTRFGVDDDVCTGDHACMRLSGCPALTLKPNPNPLRIDPVASVGAGCVGCGLCGENAQAATLCPSFFKAEVVQHARPLERWLHRWRRAVIDRLAGQARAPARSAP
jgi:indolepyruvate ferredoxin oxidoreductase alpha subunit